MEDNDKYVKGSVASKGSKGSNIVLAIIPMVVGLAVQGTVSVILTGAYMVFYFINHPEVIRPSTGVVDYGGLVNALYDSGFFSTILFIATFATLVVGFFWYRGVFRKEDAGIKSLSPKIFLPMVLLGIGGQFVISLVLTKVTEIIPAGITEQYSQMMESVLAEGNVFLSAVSTVILAPMAEELLYRGISLGYAKRSLSVISAALLQAVLFGIYHANIIQGVYAFLIGLVFAYVYLLFNTIWASILLHACFNAAAYLSVLMGGLIESEFAINCIMLVAGLGFSFLGFKLLPWAKKENATDNVAENA
ncbi:MAG: CPBP family intramembrane metalloprotease [Lachnospiraceae bacterium]|nr:CPBP family intramembrane metalloprotease [Lachnospiraceae bacterium]